jgi:amino acid transporter
MFSLNMIAQFFVGEGYFPSSYPTLFIYLTPANILHSITVAASRVTYAYSRDGALPFSTYLRRVNPHTLTPVNAVWFVIFIGALLGLLMFASPVAIGAVFSIGAIAQYNAFIIPIALKLFVVGNKFRPGPWNLGRLSKPIGVVAVAWVTLIIPVLCFPAVKGKDLNKLDMNYTCLIYGGTMFLAMTWYVLSARKWFKGPKINMEHLVVVGRATNGGSGSASEEERTGKVE